METRGRNESEAAVTRGHEQQHAASRGDDNAPRDGAAAADRAPSRRRVEREHVWWDPKDGELCLGRAKPGETLVEARSDTDVQIVRLT